MELVIDTAALLQARYTQLATTFDSSQGILWTQLNQRAIPCVTLQLLQELQHHHEAIETTGGIIWEQGQPVPVRYAVLSSLKPGVFNLGGQLSLFRELIRAKNREALMHYGVECIKVQFSRLNRFNLPLTTIALVQGDALGGGFEGVLVCDVIIAEKGCLMGFPEILFNLFAGMGAYNLLCRKVGIATTEKLLLSGKMYSSDELYALGVVDMLVDPGYGVQSVYDYVKSSERRANGFRAVQQVRQRCNPIGYEELLGVVGIWVDAALRLNERDLKVMDRFVRSQEKAFLAHQEERIPARRVG